MRRNRITRKMARKWIMVMKRSQHRKNVKMGKLGEINLFRKLAKVPEKLTLSGEEMKKILMEKREAEIRKRKITSFNSENLLTNSNLPKNPPNHLLASFAIMVHMDLKDFAINKFGNAVFQQTEYGSIYIKPVYAASEPEEYFDHQFYLNPSESDHQQ